MDSEASTYNDALVENEYSLRIKREDFQKDLLQSVNAVKMCVTTI